jgi:hypothetical protein
MALTHETRRALAERVQRRVEGRAIPRHVVDDAVARIADALDRSPSPELAASPIVAVFSAPSAPDLGSRVRAALQVEAVSPLAIGTGSAGRYTVATVRLAADARWAAERSEARISASVSFVSDSYSPSSSQ